MEKKLKSIALNYGVYLGVLLVLITVVAYVANLELLVNFWLNLIILPLTIITFGIVSALKAKSLLNTFISFKQAFSSYFITVAIGLIITTVVTVILFNFIDPDAAIQLKEISIQKSTELMENLGAKASDIEKAITTIEEQDTFAIVTQFRALAQSLIFFVIIGLIIAVSMKKKDPNAA
ncbi:DUF4199 domain-containing protein [Lacinutrix undariae]